MTDGNPVALIVQTLAGLGGAQSSSPTAKSIAIGAGVSALAAITGLAAIGCAAFALWVYALPRLGEVGAPLIVAIALAAVCGGSLLGVRSLWSPRPAPPAAKLDPIASVLTALVAGALAGSGEKR